MAKRANLFFLASLVLSASAQGASLNPQTVLECKSVSLEGLNKINARVFSLDVAVNEPAKFENLTILAQRCLMTPAEEPYEVAVYLEIHATNPEAKNVPVFSGWMFASSPSLSAMEHPIYDVWVNYDQKERDALVPDDPLTKEKSSAMMRALAE